MKKKVLVKKKKAVVKKKTATKKRPAIKKTAPKITKDTIIGELVFEHPELVGVFMEYGLHCFGCSIAQFDTIEAGARAHGIHPEHLLKDLNARIAKKKRSGK